MSFSFDEVIERRGTGCIKYDRRPELDPFWVADMDFASAPCILEKLHQRVDHGIFGYAQPHAGLVESVVAYLAEKRKYQVNPDHIVHLGGLVPALSLALRAYCGAGDEVLTCTPVYPPFLGVHQDAQVRLITVDHVKQDGLWCMDFEAMKAAITPRTKVFLFCNPQNPLARVFSKEEVMELAQFCYDHGLVLVSDEIHCDLILDEKKTPHVSALNLPDELLKHCVTLLSPSKTWNIAGLGYAYAVIPDERLRKQFMAARGHTLAEINALAYYAAEAAYRDGEPWRLALLEYLNENFRILKTFIHEQCAPLIYDGSSEATYLAWIDARELKVANPALFFEEKAGIYMNNGSFFGWKDWVRFNFACPRSRMIEGLQKMHESLKKR